MVKWQGEMASGDMARCNGKPTWCLQHTAALRPLPQAALADHLRRNAIIATMTGLLLVVLTGVYNCWQSVLDSLRYCGCAHCWHCGQHCAGHMPDCCLSSASRLTFRTQSGATHGEASLPVFMSSKCRSTCINCNADVMDGQTLTKSGNQ